jgi:glycosyltransferase involved in cell wall biosynthesis
VSGAFDVSVVISTHNRCDFLPKTLASILQQDVGGLRYEVIVVDNNSTDRTREVVESWRAKGHANLHYLFEGRQGVSYGRNTGISAARAPIVAFTDDDVFVAADWLVQISSALCRHPGVDYVGGKALAVSVTQFPRWLTRAHWSPLALFDYGDVKLPVNADNPICLGTCNAAFRRDVFARIQPFSPDFERCEDHELQLRLWRAGGQGLYLPDLVVFTEVPASRLTKTYHRQWHRIHGHFMAKLRSEDIERSSARLFDVPAHLFRQAGRDVVGLILQTLRLRQDRAFAAEARLRFFGAYFRQRRKEFNSAPHAGVVREFTRFLRDLWFR